ncbi:hypothetical protein FKM82_013909 [Ascaphus truei]
MEFCSKYSRYFRWTSDILLLKWKILQTWVSV